MTERDHVERYAVDKIHWRFLTCRFALDDFSDIEKFASRHNISRVEAIRTLVSFGLEQDKAS